MSNADKNILITPNQGSTTSDPQINFVGASSTIAGQTITLKVLPANNGTLSVEGSAGQLFSIAGSGNVGIGTIAPTELLHVNGKIRIGTQATATTDAVRADRNIATGSGLSGGGNLTANRTFAVDSTVIRTTGNQTIGGTKTFSSAVVLSTAGTATTHAVRADRNIATGTGLTGGGNLTANRTFAVDNTVVRTTGNQTVGGVKTFSNSVVSDDLKFRRFTTSTATASHFRKYTDIIHYANSTSTVAGDLRIEIPVTTSTMWTMDVVIVEYDNAATPIKTTNLTITAYTTNNANRSVLTNNPDRISQVRFGRNTANNRSVILITPASTFRYPKAYIKEINTHHANETTFNNSANYGITITTDESNFVLNGTVINNNFIRDTKLVNTFGTQTVAGTKTFSSAVVLSTAGTATTHAVRADRNIATGTGLSGGGNLTANRTFAVDSTVLRTSGNQTVGGVKTFSTAIRVTGTSKAAGRFYAGTVNPSLTTRTNYDGHLHVNQLNAVGEVTAFSDRRLKDNIELIVDPLTKILNIRGVTFTRIDQEDKDRIHMGVIAQEVEQYFPEVVQTSKDGTKSVNYGAMAGAFIEAFKAQQSQINELRTAIEKLLNK